MESFTTFTSSAMVDHLIFPGGGGGTPHMKGVGMLVGYFELNPKKRPIQA